MPFFVLIFCLLPFSLFSQDWWTSLKQTNIQQHSFILSWSSEPAGIAALAYGKTTALELGLIQSNNPASKNHQIKVINLAPAQFYYARPLLVVEQDSIWGPLGYYSTQSTSTGEIRISFNQGVDASYSNGASPYIGFGGNNIESNLITMINQATTSIDVAVFNNTRSAIVNALNFAYNNGIQVRYIANSGSLTSNAALSNAQFPVFYVNNNDLMHNKFMVIDADSSQKAWVWTGSCNWTYTDMFTNYNNIVAIQDQALAGAYTIEFEEMWGSSTPFFNVANSRVGNQKTNNTPHSFNIGGSLIESYFSPSDNTTDEIESSLYSANNDLEFCLLIFTRNELGSAVRNRHQANVLEHGLIENDNIGSPGSDYNFLVGQGVNVLADNNPTSLHHKYALIDAGDINSDPQVVTGSHNWTTAAEDRNDENTLIIHDPTVANLFLQEFAARWCEAKNNNNCALPFTSVATTAIESPTPVLAYPNPIELGGQLTLELPNTTATPVQFYVYNTLGQLVKQQAGEGQQIAYTINLGDLAAGTYVVLAQQDKQQWQAMIQVLPR